MLHFEMIVPPALALTVDDVLTDHAEAVSNVIRLPHAGADPRGDVILCDVTRADATDLLAALHRAGLDAVGSISITPVDLSLSRTATTTGAAIFGSDDDAVVWQEVEARAGDEAQISTTYIMFMVIATLIAAVGVVADQPILIVGAMVVGPDFGPLAAIAVGVVRRRASVVGRSALALLAGYGAGILIAIPFSWIMMRLHIFPPNPFAEPLPATSFIWQPDPLSYIVGFLAGIAGILSLTSAKSGALIGVLISVTTIPAAGAAGLAIASHEWGTVGTSLMQLVVNLVAIVTAGTLTLAVQVRLARRRARRPAPQGRAS
ncbi:hypothetical protein LK09_06645 [Microbacterium mangrovi]|uniref:DUF389 domain-containing protein n=1 Tax=Microbacterium mangrovi TaxID=1348253 RepID=A0A0B2A533_9MICO|nr:DUF389 domain-containing protein [Microbacterium mangrovi]KHK98624.1 hypothetical protein LK09_06645 [Microbacterium mangrovi]